MKWVIYFRGFGKGLLLLIAITIFLAIVSIPNGSFNYFPNTFFYRIIFILFSLLYTSYLVTRYKQPKAWVLLLFVMTLFVLPFLFGAIALSKNTVTVNQKEK